MAKMVYENLLLEQRNAQIMADFSEAREMFTSYAKDGQYFMGQNIDLQNKAKIISKYCDLMDSNYLEIMHINNLITELNFSCFGLHLKISLTQTITSKLLDQIQLYEELTYLLNDFTDDVYTLMDSAGLLSSGEKSQSNIVSNSDSSDSSDNLVLYNELSNNLQESSVLGPLSELSSALKEELDQLSYEDLCCFTNSIGCAAFIIILGLLFSIITTFLWNKIINYFKLEEK